MGGGGSGLEEGNGRGEGMEEGHRMEGQSPLVT